MIKGGLIVSVLVEGINWVDRHLMLHTPPSTLTLTPIILVCFFSLSRDTCGHLLTKLNACRREEHWLPWKCGHERHTYEECQYIAWNQRVDMKTDQKAALATKKNDA